MAFPNLSLLDQLGYKPTDIPKQRMWTNFAGDVPDTRTWRKTAGSGQTDAFMTVDGYQLHCITSSAGTKGFSDFNRDARHYEPTGCVAEFVVRADQADSCSYTGFHNSASGGIASHHACQWYSEVNFEDEFMGIRTSDGTTVSNTDSSKNKDTNFHRVRLELTASNVLEYVEQVLLVTKTTNLPTLGLQPVLWVESTSAEDDLSTTWRYYEAYNT